MCQGPGMEGFSSGNAAGLSSFRTGQASCSSAAPQYLPGWLSILSPAGFYYHWDTEKHMLLSIPPPELGPQKSMSPCQIQEAYASSSLPTLELPTTNFSAKALQSAPEEEKAFIIQDDRIIAVAGDSIKLKVHYIDVKMLAVYQRLRLLPTAKARHRNPTRPRDIAFPPSLPKRSWAAMLIIKRVRLQPDPPHPNLPQPLVDPVRRPLLS